MQHAVILINCYKVTYVIVISKLVFKSQNWCQLLRPIFSKNILVPKVCFRKIILKYDKLLLIITINYYIIVYIVHVIFRNI